MREYVGADHDVALDFRAEAFGAGALVHVFQVGIVFGAVAEFHAVIAAEVAAGIDGTMGIEQVFNEIIKELR